MPDDYEPDRDRVQDASEERTLERGRRTESILEEVERHFGEHAYPTTGEELAAEYATTEIDLPNETESLGSVFDRLEGEQFESAAEVREAVYGEITGEAGTKNEFNAERDLDELESGLQADSNRDI